MSSIVISQCKVQAAMEEYLSTVCNLYSSMSASFSYDTKVDQSLYLRYLYLALRSLLLRSLQSSCQGRLLIHAALQCMHVRRLDRCL
mmetsp:Transcript_150382/g.273678  ORF Transcript_150382/g.273678 Transcript_150382/m.273678 type:complete len:87 (+) Transcript_150382:3-263(+)